MRNSALPVLGKMAVWSAWLWAGMEWMVFVIWLSKIDRERDLTCIANRAESMEGNMDLQSCSGLLQMIGGEIMDGGDWVKV
jgi:hypothetical protein